MNGQSYIYSEVLDKLGWFQPKSDAYRIEKDFRSVDYINGCQKTITKNTAIGYYPGSFGTFHSGHVSAVKKSIEYLKEISPDDYVLVISPANSDYAIEKYGKDSVYSRNDYRFGKICEALEKVEGNIIVDLNPLLNGLCDNNFPNLVKDFVEVQIDSSIKDLKHKPVIVVGKDRKDFALMKLIVDDLDFFYVEDTTGSSTSKIKKEDKNSVFTKKNILLRCSTEDEYKVFVRFYKEEYLRIQPFFMRVELELAKDLAKKADFTICKDYQDLGIPYHRLSRKFKHGLDVPKEFIHDKEISFDGKIVLDSDVYSGETKRYIESLGGKLISVMDYSEDTESWDIVDFDDFKNPEFRYPYYDIATRCSMRAFSFEDHKKYNEFLRIVGEIK